MTSVEAMQNLSIRQTCQQADRLEVKAQLKAIPETGNKLRLTILRTCTVEPLVDFLRLALWEWNIHSEITLAPLGELELSDGLAQQSDALLLWWRIEDLCPDLFMKEHRRSSQEKLDLASLLEEHCRMTMNELTKRDIPCWFFLFHLPAWSLGHGSLYAGPHNSLEVCTSLNSKLLSLSNLHPHLHPCAQDQWLASRGQEQSIDPRLELFGKVPLHAKAMGHWAIFMAGHLMHLRHPRRKVIAVDADNTLWLGVLGEDGAHELKMGQDYPGNIFHRIQQRLLDLKSSGLLLALVSKNDQSAVLDVLEHHPDTQLKAADFIAIHCHYRDKSESLQAIATELGLAMDSFAFLDDQPFEREQVRQACPQVLILNDSSEPLAMFESLNNPELYQLHHGDEDKQRHQLYQGEQQRQRLQQKSSDRRSFLKSLDLTVRVIELQEQHLPRAVQLLQKTNQFNLTTRRHQRQALCTWLEQGHCLRLIAVADRFGDQGIVGLMIGLEQEDKLVIDSFLLSCRVIGRGVEDALFCEAVRYGKMKKLRAIYSEYIPSERNRLVENFWEHCGMTACEPTQQGQKRFQLQLSGAKPRFPEHINAIET